jgi:hypothetical protein
MAGELWRDIIQIGKETTVGTVVPATRKAYARNVRFTKEREPRVHEFATGTRDNVRAFTQGPVQAGGGLVIPMSSTELIEWLLCGVQGGVTPTTPGGATTTRLWTFKPSTTLDSMTIERNDGARLRTLAGVRVNQFTISGSVGGAQEVTMDLFGTDLATLGSLTGALADRTPEFYEGWETKAYIEAFGGTPGTTAIEGDALLSWNIQIQNNLGRKYTANNTLAASSTTVGKIGITATFQIEAASARAATEYSNWDTGTQRMIRLEFGNNKIWETTLKSFVTIDLPGAWTAVDLNGEDAQTRVYEFSQQYIYDPTLAAGIQIRAQNNRSTAF